MADLVYPWQAADFNNLLQLKNRVPHALLLHGLNGLGSEKLADAWVHSLLCDSPAADGSYCSSCNSCTLYELKSHPDFYSLAALEDEKTISIAAIRAMVEFLAVSTHLGRYKIILIEDAGLLNLNSSNALLKILEEPPSYALFILLTDNLQQLLPTVRSRCQKFKLSVPDHTTAKLFLESKDIPDVDFWLNFNHNCPLFSLEVSAERLELLIQTLAEPSVDRIYSYSSTAEAKNSAFIFEFMTKWICDLISYNLGGELTYFMHYSEIFMRLSLKQNNEKAFYVQDKLNFLLQWANHPLNYKLQLENILFQYQQIFVK